MKTPDILELLKAGVHFGHKKSKWHPSMKPFIFTERKGVHIVDLKQTMDALSRAVEFVKKTVKSDGVILFIGTKKQLKAIVKEAAASVGMPYITEKWVGGTITNWAIVKKQIHKLRKRREEKEKGEWAKYTKKEQITLQSGLEKLENIYGGIANLEKMPDALFITDCKESKTAVREAETQHIPIVALADTNVDIRPIAHPIPANDDAINSVKMILKTITDAIQEARAEHNQTLVAPETVSEPKP